MSNRLEELHGKYKKYLLKRALKSFALFASVLVLVIGSYLLYSGLGDSTPVKDKEDSPALKTAKPASYALSVSRDELAKSVNTLQKSKPVKERSFSKVAPTQEKKLSQKEVTVSKPQKKLLVKESEVPFKKKYFLGMDEEKSLENWIEKYNNKKSYTLAVYIAKQYFSKKDYKQSGIWAKRANQLDRNKEEAWLLYAKSVYALGDEKKAKKILSIFLQYKESIKADLLLSEWSE